MHFHPLVAPTIAVEHGSRFSRSPSPGWSQSPGTRAQAAFTTLGLAQSPAGSAWWLDVETTNSWQDDVSLNVANLQGAVDYLESVANVASVGFYSTQYQWDVITGGTSTFAAHQSWVAGGLTSRVADSRGNVYLHWRASRASWWSVYDQLGGARSNAVQVRWM